MLKLESVTLVAVSGIKIDETIKSLLSSAQDLVFARVLLISPLKPANLPKEIEWEASCMALDSIDAYNRYMVYELHRHIHTTHCLVVQYDGFVRNPAAWTMEFLNYDYIGAPWPIRRSAYIDPFGKHIRVGNGGFSLRSKKLLEVPLHHQIPFNVNEGSFYKHMGVGFFSEDGNICVHNRHIFEAAGCVFAPVGLACQFALETYVKEAKGIVPFGFHKHWPAMRLTWRLRVWEFIKRQAKKAGIKGNKRQ